MTLTIERPAHTPVNDGTRREFIAGGLTLAALLAGCGSDDASKDDSRDAGFPRDVRHAGGVTRIARRPRRVYAVRPQSDLDTLLLLGAPLVAYGGFAGSDEARFPWRRGTGIGDAEKVEFEDLPNIEKLTALRLDLIVMPEGYYAQRQDAVALYRKVGVPIVVMPDDVHKQLAVVGQATGLEQEAARRDAAIDRAVKDFTPAWVPTSIVIFETYEPGKVAVYGANSNAGILFQELGLPALKPPSAPDGRRQDLSIERLPELFDAELLIGRDYAENTTDDSPYDALEREPIFKSLKVVREGRYVRTPAVVSFAQVTPSPLSLPVVLADLQKILEQTKPS